MKKTVKLKFVNGLAFESGVKEILTCVSEYYNFVDSEDPDFIIFGPYGNEIPKKGKAVRIGYFCESFMPDMEACEWGFGIPYEEEVNHPRYQRIVWHGFDPVTLIKKEVDVEKIMAQKTAFCNFFYSNPVPYRETFFKALSKYKKVDAPGRSMNNMRSVDDDQTLDIWTRKRNFLRPYKFTIAFENYSYPGYNTEKLLDPMLVDSLPIYLGNPMIDRHFNTSSFINAHEYLPQERGVVVNSLEKWSYANFKDMRPGAYTSPVDRVRRKLKAEGRKLKMELNFNTNFDNLIERIIEIDRNPDLYAQYLREPWFYNNTPPSQQPVIDRWREIFQ